MGGSSPSGDGDFSGDQGAGTVGSDSAPRAKSTRARRIGFAVGTLVAVGVVLTAVVLVLVPRPDATLAQTGENASLDTLAVIDTEPLSEVVSSTLRAHESYDGWDVLSGSNTYGAPCLVAIAPDREWVRIECTPAPAELIADTFPSSQPDGPMIRFIQRGDTVDVWVYPYATTPDE